jgi:hypothetical protein
MAANFDDILLDMYFMRAVNAPPVRKSNIYSFIIYITLLFFSLTGEPLCPSSILIIKSGARGCPPQGKDVNKSVCLWKEESESDLKAIW